MLILGHLGYSWGHFGLPCGQLGQPGVILDHPGFILGHLKCHFGWSLGHAVVILGDPWVIYCHPWVILIIMGSFWVILGNLGIKICCWYSLNLNQYIISINFTGPKNKSGNNPHLCHVTQGLLWIHKQFYNQYRIEVCSKLSCSPVPDWENAANKVTAVCWREQKGRRAIFSKGAQLFYPSLILD